jgi:hypothetical protein
MSLTYLLNQQKRARDRLQDLETDNVVPVVARCSRTVSQQTILNNTATRLNFDSADIDTYSAVTTGASWVFTCPVAGYYRVSAKVQLTADAAWADGEPFSVDLYYNGAFYSRLGNADNYASGCTAAGQGTDIIHLDAGDTISIWVTQISGSSLTTRALANRTYVAIERITP